MEIRRAQRYEGKFSVLIADIDNFKLFNDTYGHPLGDEIIRRVAGILSTASRGSDFVARFGGDEFMLILPEAYPGRREDRGGRHARRPLRRARMSPPTAPASHCA